MFSEVLISKVKVEDRIRKDLGDIDSLAESIKEHGLLNPIIITVGNVLIAGERRLEACKKLGWMRIPAQTVDVSVYDTEKKFYIEIDENEKRKNFSREERVDYALALERLERAKAEERMKSGTRQHELETGNTDPSENGIEDTLGKIFPRVTEGQTAGQIYPDKSVSVVETDKLSSGRVREIVARHIGISDKQYEKEKYIVFNKDKLLPEEYAAWNAGEVSTHKTYTLIKEKINGRSEKAAQKKTEEIPVKEIIKEVIPSDYDSLKEEVASTKAVIDELRAKLSEKDEEIRKISSDARTINSAAFMERNSNSPAAGLISDGQVYDLYAEAEDFFFNKLAPMKWREFMDRASISPNAAEKVLKLVSKVNDWCREMYMILNNTDNDIVV